MTCLEKNLTAFEEMFKDIRKTRPNITIGDIVIDLIENVGSAYQRMEFAVDRDEWKHSADHWFCAHCLLFSYKWNQ